MAATESNAHPLDGCDPDQCYQVMMAERTALITARRESEDSLVKTVIQLASALIVLMAGFVSQANVTIAGCALVLFAITMVVLGIAIVAGLTEHHFASKAYEEQQRLVEAYFQKEISTFNEAPSNRVVRASQLAAFVAFVLALVLLGTFAIVEAKQNNADRQRKSTPSSPAAAAASTAAAPAAAAPTTAAATADAVRRRVQGRSPEVSGSEHAATPAAQK